MGFWDTLGKVIKTTLEVGVEVSSKMVEKHKEMLRKLPDSELEKLYRRNPNKKLYRQEMESRRLL